MNRFASKCALRRPTQTIQRTQHFVATAENVRGLIFRVLILFSLGHEMRLIWGRFSFPCRARSPWQQKLGDSQLAILVRLHHMVTTALFVRLEAKPGKEAEVESFLRGGLPLVEEEPATVAWFGIRLGPTTFSIFDAFPDEAGRQAHLTGKVAAALMAKASQLFAQPPVIEKADVLAAKLPK